MPISNKSSSAKSTSKTPAKPSAPAKHAPAPKAAARESKTEVKAKPAPVVASKGKEKEKEHKHDRAPEKSHDKLDKHDKPHGSSSKLSVKEEPLTMPKIVAAAPASADGEARPSITTTMNKTQLKRFRTLLEEKRDDIIKKAKQTLDEDMTLDANDLPDEMDLASSEYLQSFTFRLRGREKSFLDKINKALARIDDGTFGVCEECGEEISVKRLEARPETTLCIRCKEDQERAEKDYG